MAENKNQFVDQFGNEQLLIDPDTIVGRDGKRKRLDGYDGKETSKIVKNDDGEYEYISGELGGSLQQDAIAQIIQDGGFTNVHDTGRVDKSKGKRDIYGLYNDEGQNLKEILFKSGIADLNEHSSLENYWDKKTGIEQRALHGNSIDPYFDLNQEYQDALFKEQLDNGNYFKSDAINERYYDPDVHDDVLWRDHSRTIDNKARGTWQGAGIALSQGWDGIKEGLFGYADAFGSASGIDALGSWGRKGVRRTQAKMFENPEIVLDYQDVDGITTGFQYLLNNAAMSAPYMVTTFGAFAAAVPTAGALSLLGASATAARLAALGVTSLPNSMVYAGQTWNEMEMGLDKNGIRKPKGVAQFLAASSSGVLQASLERMGIQKLLPKKGLLNTSGKARIITAIKKKNPGMTTAQANALLKTNIAREQAKLAAEYGVRLSPDNIARWSASEAGKTALASAGIESFTEIGQEMTQAGTAALASDKRYTMSELGNRVINAGLAGGLLGGSIGTAGNIHNQANREMYRADLVKGKEGRYGIMARTRNAAIQSGKKIRSVWEQVIHKDEQWAQGETDLNPPDKDGNRAEEVVVYDENGNPEIVLVTQREGNKPDGKILKVRKPGYKTSQGKFVLDNDGNKVFNDSYDFDVDSSIDPSDTVNNTLNEKNRNILMDIYTGSGIRDNDFNNIFNRVLDPNNTLSDMSIRELKVISQTLNAKGVLSKDEANLSNVLNQLIREKEAGNNTIAKKKSPTLDKPFDKVSNQALSEGAKSYIDNDKGIINTVKNSEDLMDLLTNATIGFSKLFRAAIKVAMPMAKLVQSEIAMDIYSRVAGMASNVYHHGKSFKEYADNLVKRMKSYVDEQRLAKAMGYKLNAKNVIKMSKELRKFGADNSYKTMLFFLVTNRRDKKGRSAREMVYSWYNDPNRKDPKHQEDWVRIFKAYGLDAKDKTMDLVMEYATWLIDNNLFYDSNKEFIPNVTVEENLLFTESELNKFKLDKDGNVKQPPVSNPEAIRLLINDYMNQPDNLGLTYPEAKAKYLGRKKVLFAAATQIKRSYDEAYQITADSYDREHIGQSHLDPNTGINYDFDYWWKHQGFDWRAVRAQPDKFKAWLRELPSQGGPAYSETQIEAIYNSIARDGDDQVHQGLDIEADSDFSLVGGKAWRPWSFSPATAKISTIPGFDEWVNNNIFETLNRTQIEAAKYASVTDYFGEGGWKLNRLFDELRKQHGPEGAEIYTDKEIDQFAYYIKSIIDSVHGNFKRIKNPKLAAVNKFITSWTIMTGLPLSMISSLPETAMVFFNIKNDEDFQKATRQLTIQLTQAFDKALKQEVVNTEKLVTQIGLQPNQNTVVDRLATGARDVYYMRMHETFFKAIGIQKITQVQRRINAGFGLDYIKSSFAILDQAPRIKTQGEKWYNEKIKRVEEDPTLSPEQKTKRKLELKANQDKDKRNRRRGKEDGELDLSKFTEIELRTYNSLVELGIDVDAMDYMMRSLDEKLRPQLFNVLDTRDIVDEHGETIDANVWLRGRTDREMILSAIVRGDFDTDSGVFKDRQAVKDYDGSNRQEMEEARMTSAMDIEESIQLINDIKKIESAINEEIETALYRFVNERVQLPGAANRPLFFQDPHYQIMTQFNGFISTFTANVIPKLYNSNLRKGTIKVKYDTFALIVMMIALGGASQYLKDLIKFGQASPYMDMKGYVQRAVYSSGVMGQGERLFDIAYPLYPERHSGLEWISQAVLGEAGPGIRNIQNIISSTGQLLEGDTERAVSNYARSVPGVGPFTRVRHDISDVAHLQNPWTDTWLYDKLFKA